MNETINTQFAKVELPNVIIFHISIFNVSRTLQINILIVTWYATRIQYNLKLDGYAIQRFVLTPRRFTIQASHVTRFCNCMLVQKKFLVDFGQLRIVRAINLPSCGRHILYKYVSLMYSSVIYARASLVM